MKDEKLEQEYLRSYDVPEGCCVLAAGMVTMGVMFLAIIIILIIKFL